MRYAHVIYVKSLFINTQNIWECLCIKSGSDLFLNLRHKITKKGNATFPCSYYPWIMRTNGTVQESESINVIQPVNAVKLISSIEAVVQRCTVKKVFLEISWNWQENTCAGVSFLTKFIKKATLAQVLSREFCKIYKSTFFSDTSGGWFCL